jgi:hypothetical protein
VKDVPDIDPVVRGLIEELVANPRSSIRLAPRRALRPWLEAGDAISIGDVSSSTLERHLIAVHREAVASLLSEASRIACFKAPVLSHVPGTIDGSPFDVGRYENSWKKKAARRVNLVHPDKGIELLRQCLQGIDPERGYDLASASMSLVPSDNARTAIANHIKTTQPRFALHVFERVASSTTSSYLCGIAWSGVAGRLCALNDLDSAADAYEQAQVDWSMAPFYLINLACFLGKPERAVEAGRRFGLVESNRISEAMSILSLWSKGLNEAAIKTARNTFSTIKEKLPDAAQGIGDAYA